MTHRPSRSAQWFERHAGRSVARPWTVLLLGLLLLVVSAPAAVRLYTDLRTDLRELLPRGAPAAVALDALEKRVGGLAHLSVVVHTDDTQAGERFIDALAARLKPLVPSRASEVRYRVDEEHEFIDAHGALYADVADLQELEAGLKAEIKKAKQHAMDLLDDDDEEQKKPDERIDRVVKKLRERATKEDHFPGGYLVGEEGHTFVLLVTPSDAAVSLGSNLELFNAVDHEVQALKPTSFDPSIRVGYDGEVREVIEAQEHLINDLELSSVLVLFAVGAVIVGFYRSLRALPILVAPVAVGAMITFALGRLAIGYLNPNTAFLGSIIAGNGINAGIILLARYLEERRNGATVERALPTALESTWRATLTASGAATASYACLGITAFRGFNQFAFIGGIGMVLVWLATYGLMPALLVVFERRRPLVRSGSASATGLIARPLSRLLARGRVFVVALTALLAVGSVVMIQRFAKDPIEYDFGNLGSRQGAIDGAGYWGKHLDAVMQSYLTPTVVLTADADHAAVVAKALRNLKESEGAGSPIDQVMTLAELLPSEQEKKLPLLRSIVDALTPRVLAKVPEADRETVDRLVKKTLVREVAIEDLPPHISRLFREKDGQIGRLVLVYPTLAVEAKNGRKQVDFARSIRAESEKADPHAQVAGSLILSADIVETITHDGFKAASLSFLAVVALTFVIMGSFADAIWVAGSLALGTLFLGGALGALGVKMNFVNFAVLPITFGIGVDYAVNLYGRYREIGRGGAARAVATSGGAVALCSMTTIIGYSALLVADNRAIFSFGLAAVLGEITCLSAAIVSLPAMLEVRDANVVTTPDP